MLTASPDIKKHEYFCNSLRAVLRRPLREYSKNIIWWNWEERRTRQNAGALGSARRGAPSKVNAFRRICLEVIMIFNKFTSYNYFVKYYVIFKYLDNVHNI